MYDEDKIKKAKKIHEKARFFRGRFLNSVACIEREISIVITEFFCLQHEDTRELFFMKLIPKLSLRDKRDVVFDICKNFYPIFWKGNKEILNYINEIQYLRNCLAHSIVDINEDMLDRPLEEGVGFLQWKKGKLLTDEIFNDFDAKATMIYSALSDLRRLLPYVQSSE